MCRIISIVNNVAMQKTIFQNILNIKNFLFLFCGTFNGNLLSKIDYKLYTNEMKMFSKYVDKWYNFSKLIKINLKLEKLENFKFSYLTTFYVSLSFICI